MVVTELALFVFEGGRLILKEIAPEISLDTLKSLTEAEFSVGEPLEIMRI